MSSKLNSAAVCTSLVVLFALAAAGPFRPAAAQGKQEDLFVNDAPIPQRPAAGYVRRQPFAPSTYAPYSSYSSHYARSFGLFSPYQAYAPHDRVPDPDIGTYRTLCVRMCDGFYFPISYATSSAALARDAESCAATCGGNARLFYYANPGGSVEDMVDLTGRAYASYPTAFRYRKTLVKGCQCHPHPWSEAERARHRAYAASEGPFADPTDGSSFRAEALPASEASDEDGPVPASPPPPIDRNAFKANVPGHAVAPYAGIVSPPVAVRSKPAPKQAVEAGQWGWFAGDQGARQRKSSHAAPGGL